MSTLHVFNYHDLSAKMPFLFILLFGVNRKQRFCISFIIHTFKVMSKKLHSQEKNLRCCYADGNLNKE